MHPADDLSAELAAVVARTLEQLVARGIPDEAVGQLRPPRKRFGFTVPAVIAPAGRAWRLGVLLINRDGHLFATGEVTRAVEPLRGVNNRSHEAEERRELRRAAVRGRFAEGEVVNFRVEPVATDAAGLAAASGPLYIGEGVVRVRPSGMALAAYLADRVELATPE